MTTCALIPTYNNVGTVADVVKQVLQYLPVIVVVDGATDGSLEAVQAIEDERLHIVYYSTNRGKGYALKRGFREARTLGFTHALTIDSDGQHYPDDIPAMLRLSAIRPEAIIIGNRGTTHVNKPRSSTFANRFSNFWFKVQTGMALPDTQTGFRIYPLDNLRGEWCMTHRYEAELVVLVCSAWASVPILPVPIRVYYPPQEERVSYFRPVRDFARISLLNTILCVMALIYGLPRRYFRTVYFSIIFALFAIGCNIVLWGYYLFARNKIMTHYRHGLGVGCRFLLGTAPHAALRIDTLPVATPEIIIVNHTSLLDIPMLFALGDHFVIVGKTHVTHNVFYGLISRAVGIVTIEEGVDDIVPGIQRYVEKGYSVAIFPEGTRTIDGEVGRFHRGAFYMAEQMHLPIRPIVLRGLWQALSKQPFFVGKPREIRAAVKPLIMPDDTTYGKTYQERTKNIRHLYQHWICDND